VEQIAVNYLKDTYTEYKGYMDDHTQAALKEVYSYFTGDDIERVDRW